MEIGGFFVALGLVFLGLAINNGLTNVAKSIFAANDRRSENTPYREDIK